VELKEVEKLSLMKKWERLEEGAREQEQWEVA
jgi:hypothetical protein